MESKIRIRREQVLRSLYSTKSGLIVHSGAVTDNGISYIFAGVADAGKSTLTQKLDGIMTAINDDMNVLEFKNDGIKVSTYFTQAENRGYHYLINEKATGILKAVFFPEKEFEKRSYFERIYDKGYLWRTLLRCVAPPLKGEDDLFSSYLKVLERLMNSVPFYNIHHNLKDSSEFIARLLRGIK